MPRLTPEARLAKAQKDRDEAIARLQIAAGQVSAKRRKEDTRRKILIGAMSILQAGKNENFAKFLRKEIEKLPDRDRALFENWDFPSPPAKKDQAGSSSATST